MRVAIVSSQGEVSPEELRYLVRLLSSLGIAVELVEDAARILGEEGKRLGEVEADYVVVIGGDRLILKTLLATYDRVMPVIGVSGRTRSFLATTTMEEVTDAIKRLVRGDFKLTNRLRIEAEADGEKLPPAINEIAIFARIPGKMIRYSLRINEEFIWRDEGDGVIIATPTGSTAYALSAGGVIVTGDAEVVEVVPVNTTVLAHRPIVTSASNTVFIDEISPPECTLIIDGQLRKGISGGRVVVRRSRYSAVFVEFPKDEYSTLYRKLRGKTVPTAGEAGLKDLPPSSKLVLKVLQYEGPLTTREIALKTGLPPRTVSHALRILIDRGLVVRKAHSRDLRQRLYMVSY